MQQGLDRVHYTNVLLASASYMNKTAGKPTARQKKNSNTDAKQEQQIVTWNISPSREVKQVQCLLMNCSRASTHFQLHLYCTDDLALRHSRVEAHSVHSTAGKMDTDHEKGCTSPYPQQWRREGIRNKSCWTWHCQRTCHSAILHQSQDAISGTCAHTSTRWYSTRHDYLVLYPFASINDWIFTWTAFLSIISTATQIRYKGYLSGWLNTLWLVYPTFLLHAWIAHPDTESLAKLCVGTLMRSSQAKSEQIRGARVTNTWKYRGNVS